MSILFLREKQKLVKINIAFFVDKLYNLIGKINKREDGKNEKESRIF